MSQPYYEADGVTVHHGDCLDVLADMPDASIDAVVTDPPYGLEFMGRQWDRLAPVDRARMDGTRRDHGTDRAGGYERAGVRYMLDGKAAQAWHEAWATEALRVLKPGGHLVAFGGTRTCHRLVCALEDVGFEIRDCLAWLYGSGFPKSRNLDGGWDGWGTALKPAHEPIVLARKTLEGTVAGNVLAHGPGALNIDGCRIEGEQVRTTRTTALGRMNDDGWKPQAAAFESHPAGRWPANVVLDDEAAALLDAQSGRLTSGKAAEGGHRRNSDKHRNAYAPFQGQEVEGDVLYGDSGGASRFFYTAKASKADRGEGNTHPTVKPVDLMRWLVRLVTPAAGTVLDPFAGSGTTGVACLIEGFPVVLIDREGEYAEIIRRRLTAGIQPVLFAEPSNST